MGALIFANIWLGIPFNMVILYSGLQNIDKELYEAARVDGASGWQQFRSITLPLLQPVIGIVLILGFIYTLKVFDLIYVMTQGGPANATQTFATWSYNLSFVQQEFGQGAAQANMILVISLSSGAALFLVVPPQYGMGVIAMALPSQSEESHQAKRHDAGTDEVVGQRKNITLGLHSSRYRGDHADAVSGLLDGCQFIRDHPADL